MAIIAGCTFLTIIDCLVMDVEQKTEAHEVESIENQVITYNAPWNIFSMGFSNKLQHPFRLAIGSFLPDIHNEVKGLS